MWPYPRWPPAGHDEPMERDRNGLQLLSRAECLKLLAGTEIGRVGITFEALPTILPVNFRLLYEDIVFCTGPGAKLSSALSKTIVAFEADEVDIGSRTGWSVVVVGRAHLLREEEVTDIGDILQLRDRSWERPADAFFVRIASELVSGRRIWANYGERVAAPT